MKKSEERAFANEAKFDALLHGWALSPLGEQDPKRILSGAAAAPIRSDRGS